MEKTILVALAVAICISSAFAQNARNSNSGGLPAVISGGILNGKATSLPTPVYPADAAAVGVTGTVTVQILVDEFGKVIDAKATTGHPLLRVPAVDAARVATFSPTKLQGAPVKISGVLIYNFVAPLTVTRFTFVLSHADRTGRFGAYSNPQALASQLPTDWTQEKDLLNSLTFAEHSANISSDGSGKTEATGDLSTGIKPSEPKRSSVKGDTNFSPNAVRELDDRSRGVVRELLDAVKGRTSNHELSEWEFELGSSMAELVIVLEGTDDAGTSIEKVREVLDRVPAEITPRSREQLSQFLASFNTIKVTDENRAEMAASAARITNLRY